MSRRVRPGQGDSCADIGVAAHLVGMRMVGVVLVNPPPEAQPDEHIPYGEAEQAIAPPRAEQQAATLREVSRKGVPPSAAEVSANPRARSARLRVAEKVTA